MKLIAYHGQQSEKDLALSNLQKHFDAAEIQRGFGYWNIKQRKGCGVGCTPVAETVGAA